ncbi:hypothetical protein KK120_21990 [Virgibacillus dakarensis]|nr:hypothetical protein [Virgibacillus dakarensis]
MIVTDMYVNGAYKIVDLGYVKEIKEASVVFIVDAGEIEVEVDAVTKDAIEMINQADEEALIPLDIKEKAVILEGEPA